MGRLCIQIDWMRLAQRLARLHGKTYTRLDVDQWLRSKGFEPNGASWYCDGEAIEHVYPEEVICTVRKETIGDVTFVVRDPYTNAPGGGSKHV